MKPAAREIARILARPDPATPGFLIYGQDAMRVALARRQLVAALVGPDGEAEMRLVRPEAAELRRATPALSEEMRARGFFPGPRAVLVEDAGDGLADAARLALTEWQPGDAALVMTAGALRPTAALRKLFETHPKAVALPIYDNPPGRDEIAAMLQGAGLGAVPGDAMADLVALAGALDPGDFRQTVEKLALYRMGEDGPVTPADIAAVAPSSTEAALDDIIDSVAEGQVSRIAPVMVRLAAQGVTAVALCIAATRHFRTLHAAAADPAGAARVWAAIRNFRRRERMQKQARAWPLHRIEAALGQLVETDLALRSAARVPEMALMERCLIRLAMMNRGR